MRMTGQQMKQRFGKKIDLSKPHLRWNHRISDKDYWDAQSGEFYFAIIGDRKQREEARDFLVQELNRIAGSVEEFLQGGYKFKTDSPKMNGLLLILQSPAKPELINWHKLKMKRIRDLRLYERVTKRSYQNIISYLESIYCS